MLPNRPLFFTAKIGDNADERCLATLVSRTLEPSKDMMMTIIMMMMMAMAKIIIKMSRRARDGVEEDDEKYDEEMNHSS